VVGAATDNKIEDTVANSEESYRDTAKLPSTKEIERGHVATVALSVDPFSPPTVPHANQAAPYARPVTWPALTLRDSLRPIQGRQVGGWRGRPEGPLRSPEGAV
jgi:hypothetical protein